MISNLKSVEENREYLKSVIGLNGKSRIDWKNSVSKEIKYKYGWNGQFSEGVLKIRKYEPKTHNVYFEEYEKGISTSHLTECKLGGILNIIWNKARWMCDLGVSEEDAKKYRYCSTKKIEVKCPHCGRIKKTTPEIIYCKHSIGCSCGDGMSYPEKLMENLLIQINIKYEGQYKAKWSKNRIYDFYLPDYNIIIEVHGIQHYEESRRGRSLKEEQENDKLKEELALGNGIRHYIIIDCRESNLQYIKSNILYSELNELFDLSNIDWVQCGEYAIKNKVKEVCNRYNTGVFIGDLAKEFGINRNTIRRYLKKGNELGWCKYDPKEERKRSSKRVGKLVGKHNGKMVIQFTLKGEFIKTYPSASEAGRQTGIKTSNICDCCNGKYKTAGGFIWKYEK